MAKESKRKPSGATGAMSPAPPSEGIPAGGVSTSARAMPVPKTSSRPKSKIRKITPPMRGRKSAAGNRNSNILADERLISLIEMHATDASSFSKSAGEGSVAALRRYRDIGAALIDQKEAGKFKRPGPSIKEWCNSQLKGVIGDKNPYGMCGLAMTLAKQGKKGKPALYEVLMEHVSKMDRSGTPVGPMGINAALSLARSLARGDGGAGTRPARASRRDRLKEAVGRLTGFRDLVTEMLEGMDQGQRERFEAKFRELLPVEP